MIIDSKNTQSLQIKTSPSYSDIGLQLSKVIINKEYCKEWNIRMQDYVCLTLNGKLLRPTLYRIGGLNSPNLKTDKYFMLLKYVEAYYSKDILKMSKSNDPKHLEGRWCIIDENGIEKKEFKNNLHYPYLVKNSCIYSIENNYYNIETGEHYCQAFTSMQSDKYLFLENKYDKNKAKRGVMKIDKKTGSWKLCS